MATLAPSLRRLFHEFDVHWPHRNHGIDGWYRDPKVGHSVGHNPGARGIVHAIDVDRRGIDPDWVIRNIYHNTNVLWYIIWNRGIWSNTWGFTRHPYTLSNPHTDHMHIEIRQTVAAEQYSGPWGVTGGDQSGIGVAPGFDPSGGVVATGIGAADPRDSRDAMEYLSTQAETSAGTITGWITHIQDTRKL